MIYNILIIKAKGVLSKIRQKIILTSLILPVVLSCSKNILHLKRISTNTEIIQTDYSNEKIFTIKIYHDNKKIRDDEFTHNILITLLDSIKLISKKQIDITTDTSIINFKYYISGRVWDPERNCVGTIKLLKWKNEFIEFKFRIKSYYSDGGEFSGKIYGNRKFNLVKN